MPKKKTTNPNPSPATRWKKGQSGNPKGINRNPDNFPKKEWILHTRAAISELFSKMMDMDDVQLQEIVEDKTKPILEQILARALQRDRLEGELDNTERILDRVIGKVPHKLEHSGGDGVPLIPPQVNFFPVDPDKAKIEGSPTPIIELNNGTGSAPLNPGNATSSNNNDVANAVISETVDNIEELNKIVPVDAPEGNQ